MRRSVSGRSDFRGSGGACAVESLRANQLIRVCLGDYDRDIALVAEREENGERRILGIARLSKRRGGRDAGEADFAVLIGDDVQRQSLGSELLRRLIEVARAEGVRVLAAETLPDNEGMQTMCHALGFTVAPTLRGERVRLETRW